MLLTLGQVRSTTRLSKETFRHWKRVLPIFKMRQQRLHTFSPGDAVAIAILRELTDEWGMQIGQLAALSTEIFRFCNETSWVSLEGSTLEINVPEGRCRLLKKNSRSEETALLVFPLGPVLRRLRDELLRTEPLRPQVELPLPPTAVSPRVAGRKAR